jgi:hypothetical protein
MTECRPCGGAKAQTLALSGTLTVGGAVTISGVLVIKASQTTISNIVDVCFAPTAAILQTRRRGAAMQHHTADSGNQQLAQVEAEHLRIREILLRIAGAFQVLEEELSSLDAGQPSPE